MATAANMRVVPAPGPAPGGAVATALEGDVFGSLLASGEGGAAGEEAATANALPASETPEENLLAGLLAIATPASAPMTEREGTHVLPSAPTSPQPQALSLDGRGLGEGGVDAGLSELGQPLQAGAVTEATASSANATPPQPLPIKGRGLEAAPTSSPARVADVAGQPKAVTTPVPPQVAAQVQPADAPLVVAQAQVAAALSSRQASALETRKPASTDLPTAARPLDGAPVWLSALPGTMTANPVTPPAPAPVLDMSHNLDLSADGVWIDQLARDIASASGGEGPMRFRLSPEQLGRLQVEVRQGDDGASLRLIAETEAARAILADAQPKLVSEARAQGLRLAETHVDLAGGQPQSGQHGRSSDQSRQPALRTAGLVTNPADAPAESGTRAERYA